MPMSPGFQQRLFSRLPKIIEHFGTPFHVFDEQGIVETGEYVQKTLAVCMVCGSPCACMTQTGRPSAAQ